MSVLRDMYERLSVPCGEVAEPVHDEWVERLITGKWTVADVIEHVADRCAPGVTFETFAGNEQKLIDAFRTFHDSQLERGQSDRRVFVRFLESRAPNMISADRKRLKQLLRNLEYKV